LVKSLKSASWFLAGVSVYGGFDWLCPFPPSVFLVGFVGFQNRLVFFSTGFGKSKSHLFSASVLVSIKYFLVSAVVLAQSKVCLF